MSALRAVPRYCTKVVDDMVGGIRTCIYELEDQPGWLVVIWAVAAVATGAAVIGS